MNAPLIYVVVAANLIAFIQMGIDKHLAKKDRRRISEAQLITPALLGGIGGVVFGMLTFRHKTKKRSFQLKLLFAMILFICVAYVLIVKV